MISSEMRIARADLANRAAPTRRYLDYVQEHGFNILEIAGFAGVLAVTPILRFDGGFFDFADFDDPNGFDGVVIEAFDRDGETPIDLVAWPLDKPADVLTMYRRAAIVGLWQAMSPYQFTFGRPVDLHRTPEDWLKAGCDGCAIATPHIAARTLIDLPGRFAPRDREHAAEVDRLIKSLSRDRMALPRRAA